MKKVSFLSFKNGALALAVIAVAGLSANSAQAHGNSADTGYFSYASSAASGTSDVLNPGFAMSGSHASNSVSVSADRDGAVTTSYSEGSAFKMGSASASYLAEGNASAVDRHGSMTYASNAYTVAGGLATGPFRSAGSEAGAMNIVAGSDHCDEGETCSASFGYADQYGNAGADYASSGYFLIQH